MEAVHEAIGRRRFLCLGLAAAGALATSARWTSSGAVAAAPAVAPDPALPRWSQASTWGGVPPSPSSRVTLTSPVVLDVDAAVAGVEIAENAALIFDPSRTVTLTTTGNVVVRGVLQMRTDPGSKHALRFVGIDERRVVGGGMSVLDTDVGLWCMGSGRLDIAGGPKVAWVRALGHLGAGASSLQLAADPVGWAIGDELVVTPMRSPLVAAHHDEFDVVRISGISGRTVTLTTPLRYEHPVVTVGDGMSLTAEVLNLTRDVQLEGTPSGRAHCFIMSNMRQSVAYTTIRWFGPRKATGEVGAYGDAFTESVLGRYGLHFHMGYDGSRGSTITGVVVRDTGGHAFVPHASHGVTFQGCISYNTFDDAYWWDQAPDTRTDGPPTHDTQFLACVAARVLSDPDFRGYRLAGFNLGAGNNNSIADCIAVGVRGNSGASGFHWPEGSASVWNFQRCIAHNNRMHGIFTWQNTKNNHVVENFVCFHNGNAGISHGAYLNMYLYRNGFIYGNRGASIDLHSNSNADAVAPQRFIGLRCDGAGIADHGIRIWKHNLPAGRMTEVLGCTFTGHRAQTVAVLHDGRNGGYPEALDIAGCSSTTPMLFMNSNAVAGSRVRIQGPGIAPVVATPAGTVGTWVPEWNAVTNPSASFSSVTNPLPTAPFVVIASSGQALSPTAIPAPTAGTTTPATTASTPLTTTAPRKNIPHSADGKPRPAKREPVTGA